MNAIAWLDSLQGSGIRPGLGRVRALLRTLGRPEREYASVIVAGTNGKGSTSATLDSIFRTAGYRAGFYTSPHLVRLNERWSIAGEPVSDAALETSIEQLRAGGARIGITPTYFEALTVLAFLLFRTARVDFAVVEVGMGGRLDATNVIRPLAALITPIGMDHTEYLGNTMRKIAAEKAGVIHRGAAVLTSATDEAAVSVIRRRASQFGNEVHFIPEETSWTAGGSTLPPQRFELTTPVATYGLTTPLAGSFQRSNVALAVRAAEVLAKSFPRITREAIVEGVARTRWRGRLERVEAGGKTIWIDGCHNPHGVEQIARFVRENLPEPRHLVFGIMSDKDVEAVASEIFPLFDRVTTTEPYPPRSASAELLAETARRSGARAVAEPDVRRAIEMALASPEATVVIAGSLYLAGAAVEYFG